MLKRRDREAHLVLSKINHTSQQGSHETHLELDELKETILGRGAFKDVLRWKYMSR